MRALALPADPDLPVVWIELPEGPTGAAAAQQIHLLVGGWIRPVATSNDWVMYVNDEHDALSLPLNTRAALLLAGLGWPVPGGAFNPDDAGELARWMRVVDDLPRGTAVLLGLRWESLQGIEVSVPDWIVKRLPEEWRQPVADGNGGEGQ